MAIGFPGTVSRSQKGNITGIIIHVIVKPLFDQQAPGIVGVEISRQPAIGPRAGCLLNRRHRPANEIAFLVFFHLELVHPAIAVADRFMPQLCNRFPDFRMIFQASSRRPSSWP